MYKPVRWNKRGQKYATHRAAQAQARETLRSQTDVRGIDGPCAVSVKFLFARPKAHFTRSGALRPDAPEFVTKRPDIDNYQSC